MTAPVACKACDAKLPLVWCVQSRKMVHLRGLETIACKRVDVEDRDQQARAVANDRGNEDQRGR